MHEPCRRHAVVFAAVAMALASLPSAVPAQPTQPTTTPSTPGSVAVTRVSLFSSGVGFFQHAGNVSGDASTTLNFKADQVNDVLKSLVLQDLDGGTVSTVNYPSQDPLGHALKGFQVDLSESPAISQLLAQLRGAEVVVVTSGNRLQGKILGVEMRKKPVKDTTIDSPTLNLVTGVGLQSIAIDEATSIQLTDAKLQDELTRALTAVAAARDSDKKTVTVNFHGTGQRRVQLGYVVATPIWKTSYRLVIGDKPEDKSNLQGWAIVENQTDSDWNNISLSLVSGRPLSFQMDLYQPLYVERPQVTLDLFQGLAPPRYAEARDEFQAGRPTRGANVQQQLRGYAARAPSAAAPLAGGGAGSSGNRPADDSLMLKESTADAPAASMNFFDSLGTLANRATAGQIGELFEYQLSNITLARQSSAMVPIVTDAVDVQSVSIYNPNVLARYPLTGARVKNTTGKNLLQGPITVFQGNAYAGDAQVNNVPPGQTRLISYGIDLQSLVDADKVDTSQTIQTVKILEGTLEVTNKTVNARHYRMQNKSPDRAKTIIVEHGKMAGWTLVDSPEPVETTDAFYRFEKKLEPGKQEELVISQQMINAQRLGLTDIDLPQLVYYAGQGTTPEPVKAALQKAIDLRRQQTDLERQIAEADQSLQAITQEQNRIRENLRTIRQESALYQRLMTKLDEQETTIDKTHATRDTLTAQRDAKRAEFETYIKDLKVG